MALANKQAGVAGTTVSQALGEIVWLFSQMPGYRDIKISSLEHTVMTALMLGQSHVFYDDKTGQPVGVALWANLNEEVAARVKSNMEAGKPVHFAPEEWKSGDDPWVVEMASPYAKENPDIAQKMLKQLGDTVFKGKEFKYFLTSVETKKPSFATMNAKDMGNA